MALRHISTVSSSVNHDSKKQTLVLRVQEHFLDHNSYNKFLFHPTLLILSMKKYPKRIFSPLVLVVLVKEISGEDKSCFFVTDRSSPPTFLHSQSFQ